MAIEHNYPHCFVYGQEDLQIELTSVAGIRWQHWRKRYIIPHHAIEQASRILGEREYKCSWGIPIPKAKDWEHYKEKLSQTELEPWVLDGFLTDFQTDAITQTGHLTGCHLWHPTGAGKTLSAILWSLLNDGSVIVVTRAASRLQYGREFQRFTSLVPYVVRPLTKKNAVTLDEYLERCYAEDIRPVVIVGWEALANNVNKLMRVAMDDATLIFDESHRGKSAKRWEAIPLPEWHQNEKLSKVDFYKRQEREAKNRGGFIPDPEQDQGHFEGGHRVMMVPAVNMTTASSMLAKASRRVICTTATPIKDRVRDLWSQLDLAEPYSWGSASSWFKRYCGAKAGKFGGLDTTGESNLDELVERLKHSTHSIDYRDTHRQLPAKRRQSFYISPEDQCRATGGFAKELKGAAKRGGTALLECRLAQSASKKRKAVLDLIADHLECGHKCVVFSGRRRDVESLGADLEKHKRVKKTNAKIWAAHGGTSSSDRQVIVDDYMKRKEPCVLVGTGDAFGESLNLQDTDAAFFTMLPYTAGQIRQWEGRFCRLGQSRPVVIYYCICEDSVDEHIADILISKMGAVQRVIGDEELAESRFAIGGIDNDEEVLESILESLEDLL